MYVFLVINNNSRKKKTTFILVHNISWNYIGNFQSEGKWAGEIGFIMFQSFKQIDFSQKIGQFFILHKNIHTVEGNAFFRSSFLARNMKYMGAESLINM